MNRVLGWEIKGLDTMTGLPEYRNGMSIPFALILWSSNSYITLPRADYPGGLLMDFGLVSLTEAGKAESQGQNDAGIETYKPDSGTVIEWRALTVIAL